MNKNNSNNNNNNNNKNNNELPINSNCLLYRQFSNILIVFPLFIDISVFFALPPLQKYNNNNNNN